MKMLSRDKVMRRKVGGRAFMCYSERQMELCLSDITNKILTQREAAEKYKIPRSSIILEDIQIQASTSREPEHSIKNKTAKTPKRKPKKNMKDSSSATDDEGEIQYASDSTINLSDEFIADESAAAAVDILNATQFILKPDDYVLVEYEGEQWPGQVKTVDDDGAFVSCMNRCGLSWKWPEKTDCIFYPMDEIISTIKTPSKLGTKLALCRVPEQEYKWGQPKK